MTNHDNVVDLTADIAAARQELEHPKRHMEGAVQLWTCLTAAHRMAAAYVEDLDRLRIEAKWAYTRAIVIEYWKPWSTNQHNPGLQSAANSKCLRHLTGTPMHEALKELRNNVIAHAHEGYEGRGISLLGMPVVNDRPDTRPRALRRTFVPHGLKIALSGSLRFLEDGAQIAEIRDHIQRCIDAATQRIRVATRHLLTVCLRHIHVLEHVDQFTLQPLETTSPGEVRMPSGVQPIEVPTLTQPIALKLGDKHIQASVVVYEPSTYIRQGEYRGDGFVLRVVPGLDSTRTNYTVSFLSRRPIQPNCRGEPS